MRNGGVGRISVVIAVGEMGEIKVAQCLRREGMGHGVLRR